MKQTMLGKPTVTGELRRYVDRFTGIQRLRWAASCEGPPGNDNRFFWVETRGRPLSETFILPDVTARGRPYGNKHARPEHAARGRPLRKTRVLPDDAARRRPYDKKHALPEDAARGRPCSVKKMLQVNTSNQRRMMCKAVIRNRILQVFLKKNGTHCQGRIYMVVRPPGPPIWRGMNVFRSRIAYLKTCPYGAEMAELSLK